MSASSPYRPCPCGSGTKYQWCCLAKDEAARIATPPSAPSPPPGGRLIYHRGRPLLVSGKSDLPPGVLDHAVDFYEAKDRGEGPAAQMMRFVEPLLEAAGDDRAKMDRALTLGTAFWNLAICDDDRREDMLADLLKTIAKNEQDAVEFRALAADMIARHHAMFPALHGS